MAGTRSPVWRDGVAAVYAAKARILFLRRARAEPLGTAAGRPPPKNTTYENHKAVALSAGGDCAAPRQGWKPARAETPSAPFTTARRQRRTPKISLILARSIESGRNQKRKLKCDAVVARRGNMEAIFETNPGIFVESARRPQDREDSAQRGMW
jgi:hypothetical protein